MRKTIRIPVVMDALGRWALGYSKDPNHQWLDFLGQDDRLPHAHYLVTVTLDVPEAKEVEAEGVEEVK